MSSIPELQVIWDQMTEVGYEDWQEVFLNPANSVIQVRINNLFEQIGSIRPEVLEWGKDFFSDPSLVHLKVCIYPNAFCGKEHVTARFWFKNNSDAVAFKLAWGGL